MTDPFILRSFKASASASSESSAFQSPSPEQLLGQWFIVHTSLPFWRDKRNITIAYSTACSQTASTNIINDTTTYQALGSDKLKTVQGTNTVAQGKRQGAWDWRGSGWVKVVSNHWEILGYGSGESGHEGWWIVIHTQKSFFTPAAVHVYSRSQKALPEKTRRSLMSALAQRRDLKELVESTFEIQHDSKAIQ